MKRTQGNSKQIQEHALRLRFVYDDFNSSYVDLAYKIWLKII